MSEPIPFPEKHTSFSTKETKRKGSSAWFISGLLAVMECQIEETELEKYDMGDLENLAKYLVKLIQKIEIGEICREAAREELLSRLTLQREVLRQSNR